MTKYARCDFLERDLVPRPLRWKKLMVGKRWRRLRSKFCSQKSFAQEVWLRRKNYFFFKNELKLLKFRWQRSASRQNFSAYWERSCVCGNIEWMRYNCSVYSFLNFVRPFWSSKVWRRQYSLKMTFTDWKNYFQKQLLPCLRDKEIYVQAKKTVIFWPVLIQNFPQTVAHSVAKHNVATFPYRTASLRCTSPARRTRSRSSNCSSSSGLSLKLPQRWVSASCPLLVNVSVPVSLSSPS